MCPYLNNLRGFVQLNTKLAIAQHFDEALRRMQPVIVAVLDVGQNRIGQLLVHSHVLLALGQFASTDRELYVCRNLDLAQPNRRYSPMEQKSTLLGALENVSQQYFNADHFNLLVVIAVQSRPIGEKLLNATESVLVKRNVRPIVAVATRNASTIEARLETEELLPKPVPMNGIVLDGKTLLLRDAIIGNHMMVTS